MSWLRRTNRAADEPASDEPATERKSRRRRWRVIPAVLGIVLLVVGLAGVIGHFVDGRSIVLIGLAAFSPYLMLAAPVAGLVLLLGNDRRLALVAIPITLAAILTQAPLYRAESAPRPRGGVHDVRILTANLFLGEAAASTVVAAARDQRADVVLLQEVTASERAALRSAGLDSLYPYSKVNARAGAGGVGLWSRYRLADQRSYDGFHFGLVSARAEIPGASVSPILVSTHLAGPYPRGGDKWAADFARFGPFLSDRAQDAVGHGGAVIVAGDFNATWDNSRFRRLLRGGYRDAAEQAGAGMTRTYPSNSGRPTWIGIDHVLTRNGRALNAKTLTIPGTDHRALLVTVRLGP